MDRDFYNKVSVVEKVVNKEFFQELFFREPFVYKLMLDKFKDFLDDDYFESFERQTILLRFLKNNYPKPVYSDVLDFINQSKLKEDYTRVILEWSFCERDFIVQSSLYPYDGLDLTLTKNEFLRKKIAQKSDSLGVVTEIIIQDLRTKGAEND